MAAGHAYTGSVSASTRPGGCFYNSIVGSVYLNTDVTGAGASGERLLCSGVALLAPRAQHRAVFELPRGTACWVLKGLRRY